MHSAILITEISWGLKHFEKLQSFSFETIFKNNELVSQTKDNHEDFIAVTFYTDLWEVFEEDIRQKIKGELTEFNTYLIRFFNFDIFRELMFQLPQEFKILVNNDYGCLMHRSIALEADSYESFIRCRNCIGGRRIEANDELL